MQVPHLISIILILIYGCEASVIKLDEDTKLHYRNASVKENCSQYSIGPLHPKPVDCYEILENGFNKSGVYDVYPRSRWVESSIKVYCDMETDGGGWTVIQRRGNFKRPTDYFYKNWNQYKHGFGSLNTDFWLGNDKIFALTNQKKNSIRFDLGTDDEIAYAHYDDFYIDSEGEKYKLHIKDYSGNAGDSMSFHNEMYFSTPDRKNDVAAVKHCAKEDKGGWWYRNCHNANLNALYKKGVYKENTYDIIVWKTWKGYTVSLSTVEIKIRPHKF